MAFVFDPPPQTYAPIAGDNDVVPIRRIYCVGRNYAAHAREMGKDPDREPPFFFTKWADTVVPSGSVISYPPETSNFHYEVELVAVIGTPGFRIPEALAHDHIFGYAVGLDMTRRDLQMDARKQGRPWDTGKNIDEAAPLGSVHRASDCGHLDRGSITLSVNGQMKQRGDLTELIWSVDEIVSILSRLYHLVPGDLIFTGTPSGVGPVVPGDRMVGAIEGLTPLEIEVGAPS